MEGDSKESNLNTTVPTVGIIVIGDEILKGHVQDTNSHFFCRELWKLGVKVKKISVVGDNIKAIADEVRAQSELYDYVLTSGGIGPTHDDVTMEAIGLAFDEEMVQHPDMMKTLFGSTTPSPDNAWIKMAMAPKSTTVINGVSDGDLFVCPLMVVKNVYPFPGVPSGLRDAFIANKSLFSKSVSMFYLKEVYFTINEDELAAPLKRLQEEFNGYLEIGSYPSDNTKATYVVKVTIEGRGIRMVEKCYCRLLLMMGGANSIRSVNGSYKESEDDVSIRDSISWLCNGSIGTILPLELCYRVKCTTDVIEEALNKYRVDEICIAFNGGKDCTALLHIFHAFMEKRWTAQQPCNRERNRLKALYVATEQPFEEVGQFVKDCISRYDLDLIRSKGSIHSALANLKETHPSIKAILMGTRYCDPYSDSLSVFSQTDPSWPQYMRVHAILDWSYRHVWLFLKLFKVQYCPLYDKGYTSLGSSSNTIPNSSLLNTASTGSHHCEYLPAYLLKEEGLERVGRNTLSVKL